MRKFITETTVFMAKIAVVVLTFQAAFNPGPRTAPLGPAETVVEVEAAPLPVEPLEPSPEPESESEIEPVAVSVPAQPVAKAQPQAIYRPPARYYYAPQSCSGHNCQPQQPRQGILRRWRRS